MFATETEVILARTVAILMYLCIRSDHNAAGQEHGNIILYGNKYTRSDQKAGFSVCNTNIYSGFP